MPKRHPASGEDEDTTEEQDAQVLHTLANYLEIKSMHEKRTKTKMLAQARCVPCQFDRRK